MSAVYQLMPRPDWAATTTVTVHDNTARDAEGWARAVSAVGSTPVWIKALFGVREIADWLLPVRGRGWEPITASCT